MKDSYEKFYNKIKNDIILSIDYGDAFTEELKKMEGFEFQPEKIKEEDLDVNVSIRRERYPFSHSEDTRIVYNISLTHKPTELTYSTDSYFSLDIGYANALEMLQKIYSKLIVKKKNI